MPKILTGGPGKGNTPNKNNGDKGPVRPNKPNKSSTASVPKRQVIKEREVKYPTICINGIEIPEDSLKITVEDAKIALGWETEADYFNREKEEHPKTSREACSFGDDFLLEDEQKNKVRCWNNAENRPFYESWARSLAQDILKRQWRCNLETIIISKTGRILSGQHRLVGLVLAGQLWAGKNKNLWARYWDEEPYIMSLVATGGSEEQEVVNTLDNVKPRSLGDIFFTSPLFADLNTKQRKEASRMLDTAVDFLMYRTKPSRESDAYKYQTHSTEIEFLDRHKKLLEYLRYMLKVNEERVLSAKPYKLRPGICAAILYLMASSESDPDTYLAAEPPSEEVLNFENEAKALRFWDELVKGTALFEPLKVAFTQLAATIRADEDNTEDAKPFEKRILLANAWALFLDDQPMYLEDIQPQLGTKEDGTKFISEWPTFGGIDWGEQKKIPDDEQEMTEEQKRAAERERNRIQHEKRLKEEEKIRRKK